MRQAQSLFDSGRNQIQLLRLWNEDFRWGISEKEFIDAEHEMPEWPSGKLQALILVPYLSRYPDHRSPGFARTFHALWALAAKYQTHSWRHESLEFAGGAPGVLRLLRISDHVPGLRWEIIDFGSGRESPAAHIGGQSRRPWPNAGVLAAAAYNPSWVRSMNGKDIPYVYLPGYLIQTYQQTRGRKRIYIRGMLQLSYSNHIRLDVCPLDFHGDPNYAVPFFVR